MEINLSPSQVIRIKFVFRYLIYGHPPTLSSRALSSLTFDNERTRRGTRTISRQCCSYDIPFHARDTGVEREKEKEKAMRSGFPALLKLLMPIPVPRRQALTSRLRIF